jgi:glucose-1-phosphate cytidylyltransferase
MIDPRKKRALTRRHRAHGRKATVTATPSPGRFGILELAADDRVGQFREKPDSEMGWINCGFFVCEPSVLEYIDTDETQWEREPLERLAKDGELMAYRRTGFWRPMDPLRDRRALDELWAGGSARWKTW